MLFDNTSQRILNVGVGDYKIGREGQILQTILGCCIGICLFDEKQKIGGLLHTMLPTAPENKRIHPPKYFNTGFEEILQVMKENFCVSIADITAKIFGGAKLIQNSDQNIGQNNIQKARTLLSERNIQIVSEKVGGHKGYKIDFYVSSGTVQCQILGQQVIEYF